MVPLVCKNQAFACKSDCHDRILTLWSLMDTTNPVGQRRLNN